MIPIWYSVACYFFAFAGLLLDCFESKPVGLICIRPISNAPGFGLSDYLISFFFSHFHKVYVIFFFVIFDILNRIGPGHLSNFFDKIRDEINIIFSVVNETINHSKWTNYPIVVHTVLLLLLFLDIFYLGTRQKRPGLSETEALRIILNLFFFRSTHYGPDENRIHATATICRPPRFPVAFTVYCSKTHYNPVDIINTKVYLDVRCLFTSNLPNGMSWNFAQTWS